MVLFSYLYDELDCLSPALKLPFSTLPPLPATSVPLLVTFVIRTPLIALTSWFSFTTRTFHIHLNFVSVFSIVVWKLLS